MNLNLILIYFLTESDFISKDRASSQKELLLIIFIYSFYFIIMDFTDSGSKAALVEQSKPLSANRMIPTINAAKKGPAAPAPCVDLAKSAQEPTKILQLYSSQQSQVLVLIVLTGSLAFPSILPYFVGQYMQAVNQDEAEWGTDKMNSICLWLAIGGGTSLLCEWLQASIYQSRAHWLGT